MFLQDDFWIHLYSYVDIKWRANISEQGLGAELCKSLVQLSWTNGGINMHQQLLSCLEYDANSKKKNRLVAMGILTHTRTWIYFAVRDPFICIYVQKEFADCG